VTCFGVTVLQLAELTAGLTTALPVAESELHKGCGRIHLFSRIVVISQHIFSCCSPTFRSPEAAQPATVSS